MKVYKITDRGKEIVSVEECNDYNDNEEQFLKLNGSYLRDFIPSNGEFIYLLNINFIGEAKFSNIDFNSEHVSNSTLKVREFLRNKKIIDILG